MRCESFAEIVGDLDRDLDPAVRALALDHAQHCPGCARRLADARALDGRLQALAAATQGAEPPVALAEALGVAVRERRPQRPSRAWMAAAAIVVLAVLGLLASTRLPRGWRSSEAGPVQEAPFVEPRHAELADGYIPLGHGEPFGDLEGALVVRVQLTGASLAALGFTVEPSVTAQAIEADLVLGADGVAWAIRFVHDGGAS